ncbi:MAG TPA: glycosyltransferase family 2 protein [Bdellovibrionales bacterium]|nr:glycosyltransferase family 2 protein [Bdellovibrionales bacterium]
MNIVIPMAGQGTRFSSAGYALPKPFLPIHGKPMISVVAENVRPQRSTHRFIFIVLREHELKYEFSKQLKSFVPDCEIVLTEPTDGAARTVLMAAEFIDSDRPLVIANSDQYLNMRIEDFYRHADTLDVDGCILTMNVIDGPWSYVRVEHDQVRQVAEKIQISNEGTVGVYHFKRGADFVRGARQMIKKDIRTKNEFYVAPVYNELIAEGLHIGRYNVGDLKKVMIGLGTPEDYEDFLATPLSRQV